MTLSSFDDDRPGRVLRTIKDCLPLKILRKIPVRITVVDTGRDVLHRWLEK
jgi:hypothetical protein